MSTTDEAPKTPEFTPEFTPGMPSTRQKRAIKAAIAEHRKVFRGVIIRRNPKRDPQARRQRNLFGTFVAQYQITERWTSTHDCLELPRQRIHNATRKAQGRYQGSKLTLSR